ncbi:MAG: DUF5694 domain-containing protein [Bacteroidia bacterium]|nr:DUF5694 domain-containing protein [Bacteroidia bacterium]
MNTQLQSLLKGLALSLLLIFSSCSSSEDQQKVEKKSNPILSKLVQAMPEADLGYRHEVMILGSFHFNRARDGSDVVGKHHMDVRSPENQEEIDKIVDRIAEDFKPSIIAVEWRPENQATFDSLYQEYKGGGWELGLHEAFQIGFRVAKKMELNRIHCIDNRPPQPETVVSLDDWDEYAREMKQEDLWHEYDELNQAFNSYNDDLQNKLDVWEYLSYLNSSEFAKRSKQLWLTGLVNLGNGDRFVGADLTGHWYRRNTRLFVSARNLAQSKSERTLIIYGNAHKWILDELFEASPEFELKQLF